MAGLIAWGGVESLVVRDGVESDLALAPLALTSSPPDDPEPRFVALVEHVRTIGIDRFLFGTDWPIVEPQLYTLDLCRRVPFTDAEFGHLADASAPWLKL